MTHDGQRYSLELVELGNQAWILNCALAELYRFQALIDGDGEASPALAKGRRQLLDPACARLQTRLQALMAKWTRRMAEQADETIEVEERPWGIQVALPQWIRQRLQVSVTEQLTQPQLIERASASPGQLFLAYPSVDNDSRFRLWCLEGVDLSCSKLWWCWWLSRERPLCRQQALADNLWLIDGCGADWRDQLAAPTSD